MNIQWKEGAPAPVGHVEHTAVWLNGLVYVGGGYDTGVAPPRRSRGESYTTVGKPSHNINCYDPVNNSWNSPINTPYCRFAMTTLNSMLLTAGGKDINDMKTNQILTVDAGQLKGYTKMIGARSHTTAAGYQGILIITGGIDDKGKRLSSTELFDSKNGEWYMCNDLPQPYSSLKSVIVNNILYLLGGINENGGSLAVFAAQLDTLPRHQLKWSTHQDTPWDASAPVSIYDTHLLIVGGYKKIGVRNEFKFTSDIYMLNKISSIWEAIAHIPSTRSASAAVSTADNKIIVIGGYGDKREIATTVWIGSYELQ